MVLSVTHLNRMSGLRKSTVGDFLIVARVMIGSFVFILVLWVEGLLSRNQSGSDLLTEGTRGVNLPYTILRASKILSLLISKPFDRFVFQISSTT